MHIKKLMIFMIMGIFMISMASAILETKNFDPTAKNYGEIQIDEWLGISNKADYRLIDYGASVVDVWAEGEYKLHKKTHLFTGVFYKDVGGNRGDLSDVKFYIWKKENTTYYDPIYTEDCYLIYENSTEKEVCDKIDTGKTKERIEDTSHWIEYQKGDELEESEGIWRLEAKRKANKRIDFILEAHGKTFDEWAWWDQNWDYKRSISGLSGDVAYLNISYQANMKNDFGDLRFISNDETTELDFAIEYQEDGEWAYISLRPNGDSTIYMYYGNAGETTTSDLSVIYTGSETERQMVADSGWTNDGAQSLPNIPHGHQFVVKGNHVLLVSGWETSSGTTTRGILVQGNGSESTVLKDVAVSSHVATFNYPLLNGTAYNVGFNVTTGSFTGYRQATSGTTDLTEVTSLRSAYGTPFQSYQAGQVRMIWKVSFKTTGGTQTHPAYVLGDEENLNFLVINLETPENYFNTTNATINFKCNGTDETGLYNLTLSFDGVANYTETGAGNTNLSIDVVRTLSDGEHNWSCSGYDDQEEETSTRFLTINTTPQIQFENPTPINHYNSTSTYIPVNVTVTEDYFKNISFDFYKDGVVTTYDYTDGTRYINESFAEGVWEYNVTVWTTRDISNNTETRTINIDATSPVISGTGNLTDLNVFALPTNSTWNFTATDDHLSTCWYSNDSYVTNNTVTCNSYINTTWATEGNKTLNYCANDTFGFETCATSYIWVYLLSYTQTDTPDPVAEGFDATFNLTVNRTNIPVTTANLILNNTVYTSTSTANTNSYEFGVVVTIPDTWGNTTGIVQDYYWNYSITGVTDENTSTDNITVYELAIDDCSTYGEVILDMSLLDEETKTAVNESAGANVEIDLQLTSKDDASVYLQYNNTWMDENNPKVCIPLNVLNNSEYWIDFTIGFQATDHVWEFYYLDDGTLNSTKIFDVQTSTPLYFYDLLTTDSTSFLFNYFDQDGLAVEDAIVHVYRKYIGDGTFKEVERAKADLNGDTIVHLVEEDVIYYFVISQYGDILFTSSQYTALCQATPCTIQIEASGEGADFSTDWDLIDGGAYTITSLASTRTVNLTYSLNDTSTMNLTVYKYNNDGSYEAVATGSDTGSTGSVILTVPQSAGNVSFFATVYQDDDFKNSEWVDFEGKAQDRFGITLSLFIGALIILTLGLMAVTEGVGTLVFVILGVALAGFLGLITTALSTGVNVVVYLVVAGGILLWKLTGGRR